MLTILRADPYNEESTALMDELSAILMRITGRSGRASFDPSDVCGEGGCFLCAYLDGEAVGCGGLRPMQDGRMAEIKRVYARRPGQGIGHAIVAALEDEARSMGYEAVCLETGVVNGAAVAFYEGMNYRVMENFGKYAGNAASVCFCKRL